MILKEFLNKKKFLLINLILFLYVFSNLIGGERGLISYFEKKNYQNKLIKENEEIQRQLIAIEKKNKLIDEKNDLDYLDILIREKLKLGKKEEIIIKLK